MEHRGIEPKHTEKTLKRKGVSSAQGKSNQKSNHSKRATKGVIMKFSLKAIRINKNMTQKEVARTLGVNERTVRQWERKPPKIDRLLQLTKLYSVSIDDVKI